jgi:hypothetical protein
MFCEYLAISNDGTKMYAAPYNQYFYVSTDSGVTWTQKTSVDPQHAGIACSADGTYVYLAGVGTGSGGSIWRSSNSGSTFTQVTGGPGSGIYRCIGCSSDGSKVMIGKQSGNVYTSSDFGTNWTARTNSGTAQWYGGNISDDGTKIAVARYNSTILVSTDSGSTWASKGSTLFYLQLCGDTTGTYLAAYGTATGTSGDNQLYTSTDSGNTWTLSTAVSELRDIFGQTNNVRSLAVGASGTMYFIHPYLLFKKSTDGGVNWSDIAFNNLSADLPLLTHSGDGKTVYASSFNGWQVLKSTDNAQTWSVLTGAPRRYNILATSYDGTKVLGSRAATATYTGVSKNNACISTDGGSTFTDITTIGVDQDISYSGIISQNGSVMFIASYTGIWKSTNGGTSWSSSTAAIGTGYGVITSCSADGSIVYYVDGSPGYIYTSSNTGTSWNQRTSPGSRYWTSIVCSTDGLTAYAAVGYDSVQLYKTIDGGANWTAISSSGTHTFNSINCSRDGQQVLATTNDYDGISTYTYTVIYSSNGGSTWSTLYSGSDTAGSAWVATTGKSARTLVLSRNGGLETGDQMGGNFLPFF